MSVGDECAGDQPDQSFDRHRPSAPFGYRTHCLVCEGELNIDLAENKPDVAKYQINKVSQENEEINRKTRKCKLRETCICAEKAKYHRDCMQRFLSGVTVIPGPVNYKHFASSKND